MTFSAKFAEPMVMVELLLAPPPEPHAPVHKTSAARLAPTAPTRCNRMGRSSFLLSLLRRGTPPHLLPALRHRREFVDLLRSNGDGGCARQGRCLAQPGGRERSLRGTEPDLCGQRQ